ncbi:hypothetical protein OY671_009399, partial [Metschnikowia pulcherrima]
MVLADQVERRPRHRHLRFLLPRTPPAGRLPPPPGGRSRVPVRAGAGTRRGPRPHPPAGVLRRADRPAEPQPAAGPGRAGHRPRRARAQARGGAVPGPGPLQGSQRRLRPRRGRPAAVRRGGAAAQVPHARDLSRPGRRRRIPAGAARHQRARGRGPGQFDPECAVDAERHPRPLGLAGRQHRHRAERLRRAGCV